MSILFGLSLSMNTPAVSQPIPIGQWQVTQGDRFIVDTEDNMGYIVHENGDYASSRVGSGREKMVNYGGKRYFAATPDAYWVVKSTTIQGDKGIFGKSGLFLRLYKDGKTSTSYGIHATGNIDSLMAEDDRYKSMGCVLVDETMLDILKRTYELNGNQLAVVTTHGFNKTLAVSY